MQADSLRKKFLTFFKTRKHKIVESDSLVPKDDPTVLFTPAGMNQFKKEFLGFDSGFKRACSSQRCLRTDDLDKVGKTRGHHTFFEMLGNFSFGDYFKKEAIFFAWEFLTGELKINADKLWVSVYEDDNEAYDIWKNEIKIFPERIVKLGDKSNFWPSEAKEKGPNGPCGPCSEIFFDQGKDAGCKRADCSPACDCGRFLEVWNLVFTQFNRKDKGVLEPLPMKNIDTGMGLERLCALMQNKPNNFETGLFAPLVDEIIFELKNDNPVNRALINAVADHIRAVVFSIYDGVLPSNEGRGYVVRKIIRKSVLHLRSMGLKNAFLYKLVPVLAKIMRSPYPELEHRKENIAEIIMAEEKTFINALNSSEHIFQERFKGFLLNPNPREVGKIAFQLYDTYGIPFELSKDWLERHEIEFSEEAFEAEMFEQKNRSKMLSTMKGDVFDAGDLGLKLKASKFCGYKDKACKSKITTLIKEGTQLDKVSTGDSVSIVLDETPFYAESGGQIADTGKLTKGKSIFLVDAVKKSGKAFMHMGRVMAGTFEKEDFVRAEIDNERRMNIARNHTATHLLQAALRQVLGEHVRQQGSLVADNRLRFDFTHFQGLSPEQLNRIEELVNNAIRKNLKVSKKEMLIETAKKSGALAFFGEKYEGKVRVVSIEGTSKEFCGGTHLDSTGEIGVFKILQETSVASGVRRIEAATGSFAYKLIKEEEECLAGIAGALNVQVDKICEELERRSKRLKELEKQLSAQKAQLIKSSVDELIKEAKDVKDFKFIAKQVNGMDMDALRKNIDLIKEKVVSCVIALGSNFNGRALLVMGISSDLVNKGLDASKFIREISASIKGSGGGRSDFAQAGGVNPQGLPDAFNKLKQILER